MAERVELKMKSKNMKILIAVLTILLLSFTVAGCGEKNENGEPQTPASNKTADKIYQIGETGKTDNLEITITKVEKAAEWVNSPAEGNEYVVVAIKVTNISKEEQDIGASDFQYVADESGRRASGESFTGVKADPDTFGAETIAPGDSFEGSLVYSIPIAMNHAELHYIEGYNPEPALKFEFDK